MTPQAILMIILIIILVDFLFERTLGYLNQKHAKKPIPDELSGIYDDENYRKSQDYQRALGRFGILSATVSFIITFLALYLGWFGWLDGWLRTFELNEMITILAFFGVLFLVSDIVGTPFDLYRTFVIEEKFGFNKSTLRVYLSDKIKGYFLGILIGGSLLFAFVYLVLRVGVDFWWYFWVILTVFVLFMNMFYTSLILPLFNKLKPLEDGVLKHSIEAFSQQVGFPLTNIFVIDGSKRSSKGNAFFSGLGKKKKVVLYDTLIEKHTTEELTAVFAHEVGHYKKKHIYLSTVLSILQMGFMLFLLSRMIFNPEVTKALGGVELAIHINMLAFAVLYSPVSRILGLGMHLLSRKNEYEADAYAVKNYGAEPLIEGLKKLSADHLSNLTPHPAYVFVHYSHPPLLQRIRAMQGVNKN
jgi:STE24 endopeptidase